MRGQEMVQISTGVIFATVAIASQLIGGISRAVKPAQNRVPVGHINFIANVETNRRFCGGGHFVIESQGVSGISNNKGISRSE